MVAIEEFSRVVACVYGAAAASKTWADAMLEIRTVFGGLTAALIDTDGANRAVKSANLSAEAAEAYVQYYRKIDYVLSAVEHGPVGLIRGGRPLIALQPRSEFDADWMRPNLLNDGLFVRLSGGPRTTSFLVAGDHVAEEFDTPERIMLLNSLIPHLQQALCTERSLHARGIGRNELRMAIDSIGHGIIVLGPKATVTQMNLSATQILRERDGIECRHGTLELSDPVAGRRMARSITEALGTTGATVRGGDSILCPRPSGLRPYVVHLLPTDEHDEPPRALLIIIDPEQMPEPTLDVLRRLFGLTHHEALVATCVMRGEGLKSIADELSVSLATVKTHLHHVFAKTDTHRQAELVRLLLSISR